MGVDQQYHYILSSEDFAVHDDDNLDSVLAWKLTDINKRGIIPNYHGKSKLQN